MNDLISRQAAIEALRKSLYEYEDKTEKQFQESEDLDIEDWIVHRIFAQDMSAEDMQAIIDLPSAQQWIPCSERLPKKQKKRYWVCTNYGFQYQCRWTNINHFWPLLTSDWHWHFMDIPQHTKVVAWMPLPEPYKGEES